MRTANVKALLDILARRIRERRKALGLTQEQLAECTGLSTNYVATIEIAQKTPSLDTLVRLADALGVTVPGLLTEQDKGEGPDVAQYIARSLRSLEESDAELALRHFRELVNRLRRKRRD